MEKITVYYFESYDIVSDKTVRSPRPATRDAITQCGGVILEDTAQNVDASQLDGNGFLKASRK